MIPFEILIALAFVLVAVGTVIWLLSDRSEESGPLREFRHEDDIPVNDPRHPQRRDVGIHQLARWVQVIAIWLVIIPGVIFALILALVSKGAPVTFNWVLVATAISLVASMGIFSSLLPHFILNVSGNHVVGTKKEKGAQPLDSEGFPVLGFYLSGIHAKFFWETIAFVMDLSRDVLVTEKEIPGFNGSLELETATGVSLKTSFLFALQPNLRALQSLYHTGGRDAERVVDEDTGETVRDRFLKRLFAADAAQRLSDIFGDEDPEYIRTHKATVCERWWRQYTDTPHHLELRHGVNGRSFVISNTDYDDETGNRRKQEGGARYDRCAANVYLEALGVTTNEARWGIPTGLVDASGQPLHWRGPSAKEYKAALDLVHIGAGEVTKHITEFRAPSLEGVDGEATSRGVLALLAAAIGGRTASNQPPTQNNNP